MDEIRNSRAKLFLAAIADKIDNILPLLVFSFALVGPVKSLTNQYIT